MIKTISILMLIMISTLFLALTIESQDMNKFVNTEINTYNNYSQECNLTCDNVIMKPVDYWQNVKKSKQCDGIKIKDMLVWENYQYETGSMRPYIYLGDNVLYIIYDPDIDLVVGDVVSNGNTLHRIVAINNVTNVYTTKGDNNLNKDKFKLPFSNTKAVVCGVIRGTQ